MRPLLAALLIIASFTGPVAGNEQLPFNGRLDGTVIVTPIDPPIASVVIDATGTATRIGRFTLTVPHVVNQVERVGSGTYEFTTPNGDTLTASFTGTATLVAPGVLATSETATFTGGTGRFAGATGGFVAMRVFVVAAGTTTGSFEGAISLPREPDHTQAP